MLKSNTRFSNIYAMWKKYLISISLNILLAFVRNRNRGGNELLFLWLTAFSAWQSSLLDSGFFQNNIDLYFSTKPFFLPCISLFLTQAFPHISEFMLCPLLRWVHNTLWFTLTCNALFLWPEVLESNNVWFKNSSLLPAKCFAQRVTNRYLLNI